jgi:hypothetical protein
MLDMNLMFQVPCAPGDYLLFLEIESFEKGGGSTRNCRVKKGEHKRGMDCRLLIYPSCSTMQIDNE